MVIAGGLLLELSGEISNDACGGLSRSKSVLCVLTSSSNLCSPDELLVDLEAMEAGESRDIELKEEIDSSSFFLGRTMFLKYGKTTVALLFCEYKSTLFNLRTASRKMIVLPASMTMTKTRCYLSCHSMAKNIIW